MNLDEIITAAVEKRLNEMFDAAFGTYEEGRVQREFNERVSALTKEQFALREAEIREKVAATVDDMAKTDFQYECRVWINTSRKS